jgi:hypothetical protein
MHPPTDDTGVLGRLADLLGGAGHATAPNGDSCGHWTCPEQPGLAGATRAGAAHHSAGVLPRATGSTARGTPDAEPPAVALLWRGFVATRTGSARTRTA